MVMGEFIQETEVLIIGGGPAGYAAAFRAADLGLDVTIVDREGRLGGVCLYRGCIPSKTLLYVTQLLHDVGKADEMGIVFGAPLVDLARLRQWKSQVIDKLSRGLMELSKKRGIQVIRGEAVFESSQHVRLIDGEVGRIKFEHAIVATGSRERPLLGLDFKENSRVMSSSGALDMVEIPKTLLVIGGGYVGVELGSVYASLGSRVTMVEGSDRLMASADPDLVQPLLSRLSKLFDAIHYNTQVKGMVENEKSVEVTLAGDVDKSVKYFDRVLVAVGRIPNSGRIGLENTKVKLDERGFIVVDERRRTTDKHIFAVGDVTGGTMLAHKAMHEGKVAAEVIAGLSSAFDFQAIPAVVYSDPQIAWCGLTEQEARKQNLAVRISRFPWSASGRAVSMAAARGLTKMIIDDATDRILGVGIVGREAGEIIAEGVLAVEMGALAEDLALTIHPHPTLSESEEEAAEAFLGSSTHILPLKVDKNRKKPA